MEGIRKNGMLLVFVLGTIRKTSSQLAGISISTSQNAVMPPLNSHIANDVQQPSIDSSRMLGSLSNTNDKAGEEADDAEVICQAVKEALLALRTATPSQLENQAESLGDAVPSEVSIRYKGRKLQGRKPTGTPHAHVTSCPGEFSSQQFGACMNFFFTPQCTEQSRSLVDNLFGKNQLPTAKTLVDVRDAALRIFQDAPECQVMESEAPHTCSTGLQNLKPLHFSQFIANAIPKIEQKSSASVVGATIHVSKLAKAFSHLSNAEDTVQVGNATLGNSEDKEQAGSTMVVVFCISITALVHRMGLRRN
mmetsp:Transcript_17251/g.33248  ORF Transcript_17251/g.33248 Transcript_17251/m.33248 type:complete len:307 (-) Transcript_17251:717-1637(-)